MGIGRNIDIVNQPWLADDSNPYVTSSLPVLEENKVESLMKVDLKAWDEDILVDLFNTRDVQCILQVPLNPCWEEDRLFWKEETSGLYTVKSAYKLIQVQKGRWVAGNQAGLWNKFWRIKVPSKVANVCWRAITGCLPTMTQLYARYVPVQPTCPVCKFGDETIVHALVSCSFAASCWQRVVGPSALVNMASFKEWFEHILSTVSSERWAEVVMLCWAVWNARNELVWQQKGSRVDKVVQSAKNYFVQWRDAQMSNSIALFPSDNVRDGATHWVKPQENIIKVSVDAATFTEHGAFGIGLAARNSSGEIVHAQTRRFWGMNQADFAEAIAIKEALSWCKSQGGLQAEIESDCLVVIQAIRSKVPMVLSVGRIIEECRALLLNLNNVSLFFVKRSANMVAHSLARASYYFPDRTFTGRDVPVEVKNCISFDLSFN